MNEIPKFFVCLNEMVICELIESTSQHVVYAAPAIPASVASAIATLIRRQTAVKVRVIVQPSSDAIRLGFGDLSGLLELQHSRVEIREDPRIQTGLLVVDDSAYIFTPTPQIILDSPDDSALNACKMPIWFAEWLLLAAAPDILLAAQATEVAKAIGTPWADNSERKLDEPDDDEWSDTIGDSKEGDLEHEHVTELEDEEYSSSGTVQDCDCNPLVPEIGLEVLNETRLAEIRDELEDRPPKVFSHAREVLTYSSFLQFVNLKFYGSKIRCKSIPVPDQLLDLVNDPDLHMQLRGQFKLFDEPSQFLFRNIQSIERKILELRKEFIKPLGHDLGAVMLNRDRSAFEGRLNEFKADLAQARADLAKNIDEYMQATRTNIVENLAKWMSTLSVLGLPKLAGTGETDINQLQEYLDWLIGESIPTGTSLAEGLEIKVHFTDVTWEMLNEPKFRDEIKRVFSDEKFTKLYLSETTLGQREPNSRANGEESNSEWPSTLERSGDARS